METEVTAVEKKVLNYLRVAGVASILNFQTQEEQDAVIAMYGRGLLVSIGGSYYMRSVSGRAVKL